MKTTSLLKIILLLCLLAVPLAVAQDSQCFPLPIGYCWQGWWGDCDACPIQQCPYDCGCPGRPPCADLQMKRRKLIASAAAGKAPTGPSSCKAAIPARRQPLVPAGEKENSK